MPPSPTITPQIWCASVTTTPEHALLFCEALEEGSVATDIHVPPRKSEAIAKAYFTTKPDQIALDLRLALAAAMTGHPSPKLTLTKIPATDWLKKVAADFPPLPIARWVIHGGGQTARHHRLHAALHIDATSAFGTGEHPTTRGSLVMLDLLLKSRIKPRRMMDIGCGTGILALAFSEACRKPALGVDMDPPSVRIARQNAVVNGQQSHCRFYTGMGYRGRHVAKASPTDLIMANIFAGPLARLAPAARRHLESGGNLILAGLLTSQANWVLSAHRSQKIYLHRRMVIGEWTILWLKKPHKQGRAIAQNKVS